MKLWLVVGVVVMSGAARAQDAPPAVAPAPPVAPEGDLLSALVRLFDPFVSSAERLHGFDAPALHDARAIPPLVYLLTDRDRDVRAGAARALGAFETDPRIEQALLARLQKPDEALDVRIAASDALA